MTGEFGRRRSASVEVGDGPVEHAVPDASGGRGGLTPPDGGFLARFADRGTLRAAAAIAAALLIGFGLMLWVAAHWDDIDRVGRFALVGGALAVAVVASFVTPIRVPALLASFLAAGGLFALIGQTYQTGADAWQLFAVWALVGLPWAFSARHDALWLVWSLVAVTALSLWVATHASMFGWVTDVPVQLAAWAAMLGLAALISPWSPIKAWTGDARWSCRVVVLATIASVVVGGLAGLFDRSGVGLMFVVALALLGGLAAAFLALQPFDLMLVAFAALGVDVLLIAGLGKLILQGARDFIFPTLLWGLGSAGIVAVTGKLLLDLVRERADLGMGGVFKDTIWPVVLMTGIGALLAAVPILLFLGLLFGQFLVVGQGAVLIGGITLVAAAVVLRGTQQTSFLHQLAVVGLMVGFGLMPFGLFKSVSLGVSSALLALIAGGLALFVGRSWSTGLLGAIGGAFAVVFVHELLPYGRILTGFGGGSLAIGLVIAAGAGWLAWRTIEEEDRSSRPGAGDGPATFDTFVDGAMVTAILGSLLVAGPTFLVAGMSGFRGGSVVPNALAMVSWSSLSLWSGLLAGLGCGWLMVRRPDLQTTLGLGASLITVAISFAVPGLGALVLLLVVAALAGRRVLAIGAFAAALWVIGSFYYYLAWPLVDKAALLVASGVMLAVLCFVNGFRPVASVGGDRDALPWLPAAGLIGLGALAVTGLAGQSIAAKEAILASGQRVYLALAPVDPRSLIQGDYMALNFALPNGISRSRTLKPTPGGQLWAIAKLDERHIATLDRVATGLPEVIRPGEVGLVLTANRARWIVSTDAWFFKEGTGAKWRAARFGEFRVGADGTALLVSLADEDLNAIK